MMTNIFPSQVKGKKKVYLHFPPGDAPLTLYGTLINCCKWGKKMQFHI